MGGKALLTRVGIVIVVLIGTLAFAGSASAKTIYVNESGASPDGMSMATGWNTIQEGVDNASTELDSGGE